MHEGRYLTVNEVCEHLNISIVGNLHRTMLEMQKYGVCCVGLEGGADSCVYTEFDYCSRAIALVVGSEGSGLTRLTRKTCDQLIGIPMTGKVGSLNASVATAVALYEIVRQRNEN